jgi:hypothetical protein
MRRRIRLTSSAPALALALALSGLASGTALAQHDSTAVRGWVRDARGNAIESAEVLLLGTDQRTRSGDAGAFRLEGVRPGRYSVGVRRLGYEPLVFTLTLAKNDTREFDVRLDALPVGLPEVKVVERSQFSRRYQDFERRRRSEWGYFYTRDDIERQGPYALSNLAARHFFGVSPSALERGFSTTPAGLGRGFSGVGHGCLPLVSANGAPPMPGWSLGDFFPDEVEAMEIYRGRYTRLPVELASPGSGCGVVVLWLR